MTHRRLLALLPLFLAPTLGAGAQVTNVRSGGSGTGSSVAAPGTAAVREAQTGFERFRRNNLPPAKSVRGTGGNGSCDEQVGNFCYWYDESEPPPPAEPERIREARSRLIATLDSAAKALPLDRWIAGQRVRYLVEAERFRDAVVAAKECGSDDWWCKALLGMALHLEGDFVDAEGAFAAALEQMPERERCAWRDFTILLDDTQRQQYRNLSCEQRTAFENRVWWLARPLYSSRGNDARTEWHSRVMMTKILDGSATAHQQGFDADEQELLLRYSWPRAFSRSGSRSPNDSGPSVVGHEPTPAYPYIPNAFITDNPVNADSMRWHTGMPPVRARYAPAYSSRMRRLDHQTALFRRGDSALVVMAYDLGRDSVAAADLAAALVLTRGDSSDATIVRSAAPKRRDVLTGMSTWGPLLLSAEVYAPSRRLTARARYGIRPPYSVGTRVTLSDVLLFEPYGSIPQSIEEALPHAMPSLRVRADQRIGFFWESYGTDPNGEPLSVALTVASEYEEPSFWKRRLQALRLSKDVKPVSVSLQDVSARGTTTSARAVVVDISTLKPGSYLVELEIGVAGQYKLRTERRIEVVP